MPERQLGLWMEHLLKWQDTFAEHIEVDTLIYKAGRLTGKDDTTEACKDQLQY